LASIEEDYKGLGDEKLLSLCRERLSKLEIPLSQAIAEERVKMTVGINKYPDFLRSYDPETFN